MNYQNFWVKFFRRNFFGGFFLAGGRRTPDGRRTAVLSRKILDNAVMAPWHRATTVVSDCFQTVRTISDSFWEVRTISGRFEWFRIGGGPSVAKKIGKKLWSEVCSKCVGHEGADMHKTKNRGHRDLSAVKLSARCDAWSSKKTTKSKNCGNRQNISKKSIKIKDFDRFLKIWA